MWIYSCVIVGLLARDERMQPWHVAVWSLGFGLLTIFMIQPYAGYGTPALPVLLVGVFLTNFLTGLATYYAVRAFLAKRRNVLR
jgi:hypothetical protein